MDWNDYYKLRKDSPHTPFLEKAVREYCTKRGQALDVGAGNLRDTKFLLEEGFAVTAVDPEPVSTSLAKELNNPSLVMVQEVIGKCDLAENHFYLINAQDILSHFPKERFGYVMQKLIISLRVGGVFCASFFGKNHFWNKAGKDMTFVDKTNIESIFFDFNIVYCVEEELDKAPALSSISGTNEIKHWHAVNIIAIRK